MLVTNIPLFPTMFSVLPKANFAATFILSSASPFNLDPSKNLSFGKDLKVALQILGRKLYKNTGKSSLYSQSLLIFIHRTPVVERHPITREIRDLLWPRSTPTGNTIYSYKSSLFIYTLKIHR